MKQTFFLILSLLMALLAKPSYSTDQIYSHHWWTALPQHKSLLIHDIFIISFDKEKRLAEWTAYLLTPSLVWGELKAKREYKKDPLMPESLAYADYAGASNCDGVSRDKGYDKGHLAPLGSFKGSVFNYQAQYLTNIVPQRRDLNQGPWKNLEERIRSFVKKGNKVQVLTGPLYEEKIAPCWKKAQTKLTQIPSSYWKLVAFKQGSTINLCSVVIPQSTSRKSHPKKFIKKASYISNKTGLNFLGSSSSFKVQESCSFLF